MDLRYLLFILLIVVPWGGHAAHAADPPRAEIPALVPSLRNIGMPSFCGEKVPMGDDEVRERFEKELLLTLWDRPQVILWLKRSRRYLPVIEEMLKESDLPGDLKYMAVAESALRPHAGSRKGAIGFWQFMPGTGRRYGLKITARVDERRNLRASTQAAVRYLKVLHDTFGAWTLAAAAFNMGEEGLTAEVLEQGTKDYFRLYLPLETQRFVFRILCVKLILEDPAAYGFQLSDQDYYPPLQFDRVRFDLFQETPIRVVAETAGTDFKTIKDLNPEIRGHYLAAGTHEILVPKGGGKGFHARLSEHLKGFLRAQRERIYVVKEGDNLSTIAQRFDVPLASLLIWNRLNPKRTIHPGDRLVVHEGQFDALREDTNVEEEPR